MSWQLVIVAITPPLLEPPDRSLIKHARRAGVRYQEPTRLTILIIIRDWKVSFSAIVRLCSGAALDMCDEGNILFLNGRRIYVQGLAGSIPCSVLISYPI